MAIDRKVDIIVSAFAERSVPDKILAPDPAMVKGRP
jgi:hypothetical protein